MAYHSNIDSQERATEVYGSEAIFHNAGYAYGPKEQRVVLGINGSYTINGEQKQAPDDANFDAKEASGGWFSGFALNTINVASALSKFDILSKKDWGSAIDGTVESSSSTVYLLAADDGNPLHRAAMDNFKNGASIFMDKPSFEQGRDIGVLSSNIAISYGLGRLIPELPKGGGYWKRPQVNGEAIGAEAGSLKLMNPNDGFLKNVTSTPKVEGSLDVVAHGTKNSVYIGDYAGGLEINHRVLARLIKQNPEFSGQSIRLLSCNTGECANGFAQNLANKLNVKVSAPNQVLWAWPDGKLGIYPMNSFGKPNIKMPGRFVNFLPFKK